jgi:predicted O-methyltransferase YrrM
VDTIAYAEGWLPEDAPLRGARARAVEVGIAPVSAAGGACLRFLAALTGARAVVETGTGTGVSTLWLLRGMHEDGVITSIDAEPEHQRQARLSLAEAGVAAGRTRLICGQALDVLPRLSDGGYDLVHLDCAPTELVDQVAEALRLLRPGGVLAVSAATWHGRVPDPGARDPETVAMRGVGTLLREDPRLVPVLLPVGDGLIAAVSAGTASG